MVDLDKLDWRTLIGPVARAEDAVSRLDERLRGSAVRDGWINRMHYYDAAAAVWNDGDLIQIDDFVLHDHGMDIRTPTPELGRGREVLTARRKAVTLDPKEALGKSGVQQLVGAWIPKPVERQKPTSGLEARAEATNSILGDLLRFVSELEHEVEHNVTVRPTQPMSEEQDQAFGEWTRTRGELSELPDVLHCALLIDQWTKIDPIPKRFWVGRLLAGLALIERKRTSILLPLHLGRKIHRRTTPGLRDETIMGLIEQITVAARDGIALQERLVIAAAELDLKVSRKRAGSRHRDVANLLIAQPVVTAPMIERKLGITDRSALMLMADLAPLAREITGRKRFRAWSIVSRM